MSVSVLPKKAANILFMYNSKQMIFSLLYLPNQNPLMLAVYYSSEGHHNIVLNIVLCDGSQFFHYMLIPLHNCLIIYIGTPQVVYTLLTLMFRTC